MHQIPTHKAQCLFRAVVQGSERETSETHCMLMALVDALSFIRRIGGELLILQRLFASGPENKFNKRGKNNNVRPSFYEVGGERDGFI